MAKMPKLKVEGPNTGGGLPFFNPYKGVGKGVGKPKVRSKVKGASVPKVPKVPKAPKISGY